MSNNNAVNNIFKNQPVRQTAVSTTALATDVIIEVTNTSAARTVTLPTAAASNLGKFYVIKDTSGGAETNNITIIPTSGLLDGAASGLINTNYGFLQVYSDGSGWFSQATSPVGQTSYLSSASFSRYAAVSTAAPVTSFQTSFVSDASTTLMSANSAVLFASLTQLTLQNATVGSTTITVGNTGRYLIETVVNWQILAAAALYTQVVKNGNTIIGVSIVNSATVQAPGVTSTVVNLNAGDTIELRMASNTANGPTVPYIEINIQQLPTATIGISTTAVTQYGSTVATSNVTPGNNSGTASALTFMYVTVPSAGVWQIDYLVRGNVGGSNMNAALFSGGNTTIGGATGGTLVPNSEIMVAASAASQACTGTGVMIVTAGAATTYVCGVYSPLGTASAAVAGDQAGRSSMKYVQIGGFANLTPSVPVRTYLGSIFSTSTQTTYVDTGLTITVPAGTYSLRYNLTGDIENNGSGALMADAKFVNVTAGNIDVANSLRNLFGVYYSVAGSSGINGGTATFDLQVINAAPTTYKVQVRKYTTTASPNTNQPLRIYAESFIEYRPDIY